MICSLNASRPLSSAVPMIPSGLISEAAMAAGTKVISPDCVSNEACQHWLLQFQLSLLNPSLCIPSSCGVAPATVLTLTQWFQFLALVIMRASFHQSFSSIAEFPALVTNPDLSNRYHSEETNHSHGSRLIAFDSSLFVLIKIDTNWISFNFFSLPASAKSHRL